jgi:predicted nucleic acid-binding protein
VFLDTNILVYATRPSSAFHAWTMTALDRALGSEPYLAISRQVLREYLAVVTRPGGGSQPLPIALALDDVVRFAKSFRILEDGPQISARLAELCRSTAMAGRQVHDANIVATMLAYGETRLLTANGKDFVRFVPRIELVAP